MSASISHFSTHTHTQFTKAEAQTRSREHWVRVKQTRLRAFKFIFAHNRQLSRRTANKTNKDFAFDRQRLE